MKLEDRIDLALNIAQGLGGQIDGKQWHDLLLHLSEAQAELKKLPIHDVSDCCGAKIDIERYCSECADEL